MQPSLNAHIKQSFGSTHILSVQSRDTSKGHQKRPDGLTLVPWAVGRQILCDVTVFDSLAPRRISACLCNTGMAEAELEDRKIDA